MASETLNGIEVALLVMDGFEQAEMTGPRKTLDAAAATTRLVSPKDGQVKAWTFTEWGDRPDHIPAFNPELVKRFASARRQARRGAAR